MTEWALQALSLNGIGGLQYYRIRSIAVTV